MNADFLTVLEFWEREKGISRDILVAAVEEALLSAAKKAVGPARELRCVIDQKPVTSRPLPNWWFRRKSFPNTIKSPCLTRGASSPTRNSARKLKWK
jgi:hypothetical protein